ncbi:putative peroxidase 48 [Phtheirospermum japonicum]|uniref:Peroxidase n=1 Tax=Phtheirospermum japonicum TaxID=374723 RepID=A0A830C8P7_9LAMI|nr:putative peroxidase 48 [Phtheirospermum japonicum]
MKNIILENEHAPAQLLRLLFHDCFIQGCDASVMLNDTKGMANNQSTERQAAPNLTLKGFNYVDIIKELLESECPGVVSCADILVLATRDALVLTGGPYYPVSTGRKDSTRSYPSEALAEIPTPDSNISQTLHLFAQRGFNQRETTALLGAHNIGRISCEFMKSRLETPEGAIPLDFLSKMKRRCAVNGSMSDMDASLRAAADRAPRSMQYYQGLSSSGTRGGFGNHYYRALTRGKGLLTADQELLADEETAKAVFEYVGDVKKFRLDFAAALVKLSNLNVLVGPGGEVRRDCSSVNSDS